MKTQKLLAGLLGLCIAGAMSASQSSPAIVLNVVGSTAFRKAVVAAEVTMLSNAATDGSGFSGTPLGAYTGSASNAFATLGTSDQSPANQSDVYGYLTDGVTDVLFRNNWTGSAAGLIDLTQGNTAMTYIPTGSTLSSVASGGTNYTSSLETGLTSDAPQITFGDAAPADLENQIVSQGSVGTSYVNTILASAISDPYPAPSGVAVVTFQWVVGSVTPATLPAALLNMTQDNAAALIATGHQPLSTFTGSTADDNNWVLLVGRSEDSGSRTNAFAEANSGGTGGAAAAVGQACKQYMISGTGIPVETSAQPSGYTALSAAGTEVTTFALWPSNWAIAGETSLNWNSTGHSGYNNGGDVGFILGTPEPVTFSSFSPAPTGASKPSGIAASSSVYFVGYLGTADVSKATGGGGKALTYNGVGFSAAAVESGQYGLWGYEHILWLTSALPSTTQNPLVSGAPGFGSLETAQILGSTLLATATSNLASAGVKISDMTSSGKTIAKPGGLAGQYAN